MDQKTELLALKEGWQEVTLPYANWIRSFVSGDPTGDRIRMKFYRGDEPEVLWGRVWFGPGAEGPPGHAHGGAQAAVLDELLGGAVWVFGHRVVALNLQTDFVSFVPLKVEHVLRGEIVRREGRKIFTEGTIEDTKGKVLARGKILFLELTEEQAQRLVPGTKEF
ncbi:MAG: PaaI family thioesterase [Bdellovibrionota bacterium]